MEPAGFCVRCARDVSITLAHAKSRRFVVYHFAALLTWFSNEALWARFLADRCRCLPFGMDFFSRIKPWCVGGLPSFFYFYLNGMDGMHGMDGPQERYRRGPHLGTSVELRVGVGGEEVRRMLQCVKSE